MCIEYDGIQHFEPIEKWGGIERFNKQLINDNIKNEYCVKNNINLLRISYKDINNIEIIINAYFIISIWKINNIVFS
jgi:hypothetical protein